MFYKQHYQSNGMQGMKNISTRDLCSLRTEKTQNLHLLQDNIRLTKQNKDFNTKLKICILVGIFTDLNHEKIKTKMTTFEGTQSPGY